MTHRLEDPGVQPHQPHHGPRVGQALLAFHEHLHCRVLEIRHAAHVERQHPWLVLCDQRADPIGHLLRVDEEQAPLGPQDQQPLERLVVRVLGGQRPEHVGAALAADD
jgi:hypothetical protein